MVKRANKEYTRAVPALLPKTEAQERLIEAITNNSVILANGSAGTGKTYISTALAAIGYIKGTYKKIILSRANVPTGRTLGHFPGSIEDKLTPWLLPALDVLQKFLGDGEFKYCKEKKIIQLQPLETIRGRSFEDSFILVDEAQNLTKDEVISILTRQGEGSTLVLSGDPFQTDIKGENGLYWISEFSKRHNLGIPLVEFTVEDIVRSETVKTFLTALHSELKIST